MISVLFFYLFCNFCILVDTEACVFMRQTENYEMGVCLDFLMSQPEVMYIW